MKSFINMKHHTKAVNIDNIHNKIATGFTNR